MEWFPHRLVDGGVLFVIDISTVAECMRLTLDGPAEMRADSTCSLLIVRDSKDG